MAPIYLGMSLALVALGIKFFMEVYHLLSHVVSFSEADMVLVLLALVDMALVGSLIVMVMFSGYENFVSRSRGGGTQTPAAAARATGDADCTAGMKFQSGSDGVLSAVCCSGSSPCAWNCNEIEFRQ